MAKNKRMIKKKDKDKNLEHIVNLLEKIINNEFVANSDIFYNDFKKIIERIKDDSFRLAIVGEFSSGKSTFLNALIGKDILKHGAQETTATVTEIYNDHLCDKESSMDVYFSNGTVKKNVPLDEIEAVTATASDSYLVANEIERVVIKSRVLDTGAKVCFVDTPGLNGIADNHREKTIEQIKNAHACIYLMQVRGLGQSDIEFLKYICKYQHNIIFVQNFIDELKKLEGETPEQKIEEQTKIIEEKIVPFCDNFKYKIVGASSRKALISRAKEYKEYNGEILTEELREIIYDESRFEAVINLIDELMVDNEKEKIKIRDAIMVAINLLEQLRQVTFFESEKEKKEWETTTEGINKKNYEKLIEILKENKELYLQKLKNYIEAETSDIRRESKKKIIEEGDIIVKKVKDVLDTINNVDMLEKYIDNSISNYIYEEVSKVEINYRNQMNIKFENLLCSTVLRIKQYTGINNADAALPIFETKENNAEIEMFTEKENEIDQIRVQIAEKKKRAESENRKANLMNAEKISIDNEIAENTLKMSENVQLKNQDIVRLGKMPEKEIKYKPEVYYEDRGGLGLMDLLLGPKRKTRTVSYPDYTKQNRWKKKKADIENQYKEKENAIKAKNRALESKKQYINTELEHIKKTEPSRQNEIIQMERLLNTKLDYLTQQKEKAKQEYLNEIKKSLIKDLEMYIKGVKEILIDNLEMSIIASKNQIIKVVNSLFEVSYKKRIKTLETMVSENDVAKDLELSEQLLKLINRTTKELEEYL